MCSYAAMAQDPTPLFLTAHEVSALLRVSLGTVYRREWQYALRLTPRKIRHRLLFDRQEIEAILKLERRDTDIMSRKHGAPGVEG